MEVMYIEFPAPAEMLNLNDRLHWRKRNELEQAWQMAAFVAARNSGAKNFSRSVVTVIFKVASKRRRDPHNFVATVKPIVDGLVKAGWWPDDNSDWVAVTDPIFVVVGSASPQVGMVVVELEGIT